MDQQTPPTQTALRPPAPANNAFMDLDVAHYSLQFSDTAREKKHDAAEMFSNKYDAITGTESGERETRLILRTAAHNAGYTLHVGNSNFVAFKKKLIRPNSYKFGSKAFVNNDLTFGPGHDLHVTWGQIKVNRLGTLTVLASHYATKGRPVRGPLSVNLRWNKVLAKNIGDMAEKFGEGSDAIVLYGGDQNIVDRTADTFFGEDLTSVWDELQKWENTGHGNLDVIASYDRDHRVKARYIRALDDKEQFMHTDHYPVEAGFRVQLLSS